MQVVDPIPDRRSYQEINECVSFFECEASTRRTQDRSQCERERGPRRCSSKPAHLHTVSRSHRARQSTQLIKAATFTNAPNSTPVGCGSSQRYHPTRRSGGI